MRRPLLLTIAVLAVAVVAAPTFAQHHGHGGYVGWGVGWGPGWGWGGWWGPWPATTAWVGSAYPQAGPPNLGVVDTDVSPERALVYLDGDLIGSADDFDGFPDYLYLKPGRYALEFRLGGYRAAKVDLEVESGQYFPFDLDLERQAGEKITPWYEQPENLPTGRVFGPKTGGVREPVSTGPDPELREEASEEVEDVEPREVSEGAALEFRINPDNASVYVDGELMGTGEELGDLERGLAVSAGRHRLDVLAPGRLQRSFEVEVRAGERRQVVVELPEGLDKEAPRE